MFNMTYVLYTIIYYELYMIPTFALDSSHLVRTILISPRSHQTILTAFEPE